MVIEKERKVSTPVDGTASSEVPQGLVAGESHNVDVDPARRRCHHCGRWVPSHNVDIHEITCDRSKVVKKPLKSQKVESHPNAQEACESLLPSDGEQLLDAAIKARNCCGYSKCKESVTLFGQQCKFCRCVYCLQHFIAEVHGCGDAAKIEARKEARRRSQSQTGVSRSVSLQTKQQERQQLQLKLSDQLDKLKKKRIPKQGPK